MDVDSYAERDFQDSPLGPIPAAWEVVPLSYVTLRTKTYDPTRDPHKEFRYIDVSSVSNETNVVLGYNLLLGKDAPSRARKLIHGGDTIFSTVRPYLRNIAQVPSELHGAICSTGFCVIRVDSSKLHSDYLFFAVLTDDFVSRVVALQRGSSYPAVTDENVKDQLIALPPLEEQRRIAAVLNAIQADMAAQADVIEQARAFKRSLMQRLFTYGAGQQPAETQLTEIGEIPSHWEMVELGSVTDSSAYGPRFSGELYDDNGNVATLRTTDLDEEGHINYSTMPRASLDLERFINHFLYPNDFVITRSGTCGVAAVFDSYEIPVLPGAFLIRFRLKSAIEPYFLREYVNSSIGQDRISVLAVGAVQKNISGTSLKSFYVPLPPLDEQHEIAGQLADVDAKIAAEEDRKRALHDLFQSTLHELMTGRVRVGA